MGQSISHDDSEEEPEKEKPMTAEQVRMQSVLASKGQKIIFTLLDSLNSESRRSKDLEQALTSMQILSDFCENQQTFDMLTSAKAIKHLVLICCMSYEENEFLPYAMKLLKTIMAKLDDNEDVSTSSLETCKEAMKPLLVDLSYGCLITLRDKQCGQADTYTNQCQENVSKFGLVRMRALELLRGALALMAEQKQEVSQLMRKKILQSMLSIISEFKFSTAAHCQVVAVLKLFAAEFDEQDVQ